MKPTRFCKQCQSGNCGVFPADVRIYLNGARTVSAPPMSPAPNVVICMECGWSEFLTPSPWLAARWLRPIEVPAYLAPSPVAVGGD